MKLLLVILFPFIELYFLVQAGEWLGGLGVVAAVIGGILFGGWIIQNHGRSTLTKVQGELNSGRLPQESMVESLLVFLAGLLFIIPGFISDFMGLLLLIPPVRTLFAQKIIGYFAARQKAGQSGFQGSFIYYSSQGRSQRAHPPTETVIDCTVDPVKPESHDCNSVPSEGEPRPENPKKPQGSGPGNSTTFDV